MPPAESAGSPLVLFLNLEPSLLRIVSEVLTFEGCAVVGVTTAAQAVAALSRLPGSTIVLIDNLWLHVEGQRFLEVLRHESDLRAHLCTFCMDVEPKCTWARHEYGDLLDAYLVMPFTLSQLLDVLEG